MENKQEQIEKIAIIVKHNCNKQGIAKHCPERISNSVYTEGYRKASDVIDEFVERLKKMMEYREIELDDGSITYEFFASDFWEEVIRIADKMKEEI